MRTDIRLLAVEETEDRFIYVRNEVIKDIHNCQREESEYSLLFQTLRLRRCTVNKT